MTEHYVTLFDSTFLPQGLALHSSLLEHCGDFILWVLCLDKDSLQTLQRLDFPRIRLIDLFDLETTELSILKASRSRAEYCWTLTPFSIQWVLELEPSASRVTYLDADTYFFGSPSLIFSEFDASEKSVLITEHGYAPEYDMSWHSGLYCVQFMVFVREKSDQVLHWWRDRCLEWCFARLEDDKFGDQMYLEKFSLIFPDQIFVIGSSPFFQGPWNSSIFAYSSAMLYHFHGLRICSDSFWYLTNYNVPRPTLDHIYRPYCSALIKLCNSHSIPLPPQSIKPSRLSLLKLWLKKRLVSFLFDLNRPPYLLHLRKGALLPVIW